MRLVDTIEACKRGCIKGRKWLFRLLFFLIFDMCQTSKRIFRENKEVGLMLSSFILCQFILVNIFFSFLGEQGGTS